MNSRSIDIIVPSFRLNEAVLTAIINLPKPNGFDVFIYIISDNPNAIIPAGIQKFHQSGKIKLLINKQNLGVSATRNRGINTGNSKWILLLDDDVNPQPDLLTAYASAIERNDNAIGFAGVTYFPPPVNAVTTALDINGYTGQFKAAAKYATLSWIPTANIMLNRFKTDKALFDPELKKGGEDIDFLVRNSLLFDEKYIAVPEAIVWHPWWNNGHIQTGRMFRYGAGVSEIANKQPIKNYTFRDFTNTCETIVLLLILYPVAVLMGCAKIIAAFFIALLAAEFITNWIKAVIVGKRFSPLIAFHLMWAKNCYEAGFLYTSLARGYINGFAERVDLSFTKIHPSPFRTNRWKIIKMILLIILFLVLIKTL